MGTKHFRCLEDFFRHGQHIHLICGQGSCQHFGIVNAYEAYRYFSAHRWPTALQGWMGKGALDHFRCRLCGHRAGRALPTEREVTVTCFFPADEKGWAMLVRRLRD